ncbi:MAG: ornithine carbamoyltransferase [Acidimicrobiales bacterium]|jgi:ornithine carbamoyltransferase|nr:ornithine carbamoyltransferase [Acidimicrobiales bacterium]MDP6298674.1 ornithine carbamoyltransferase [Acidimicrobiales bacterium]HJM28846.1 ornithine carbamoyltransferase [Acidimicrobiales bacterium]HJM97107.1 ornithine carbamoyltransferase [Acidimicrobiales bacterium]
MTRHLLEIDDLNSQEIEIVLNCAENPANSSLQGKGAALLFEKPSNRTRNSMEMAVVQLGGHPVTIRPDEVGLGKRESTGDIARTLSCYHAVIGARVFDHGTIKELAEYATVPVINMLSDASHPLQALADLLTIRQEFGKLTGLELAYIGDSNNVARSLAIASGLVGINFRIASPNGYEFADTDTERILQTGINLVQTDDPDVAIEGADVVYTDVWTSMGQESERDDRLQDFSDFSVTSELLKKASKKSIFLHCLPAHPGEEATREVLDGQSSRIWKQAENRMHTARGLLMFLLNEGIE